MKFSKFWTGHNVALYEEYHVSKNLSYIPTLRGPNCNLRRSILPCFLCCNASHLILSAYLPHLLRCPTWFAIFCHSSCSCLDVNMRQNGKLCGASDKLQQICTWDRVHSVTTRKTERTDPESVHRGTMRTINWTLERVEMSVFLLDVSRHERGGARLCM